MSLPGHPWSCQCIGCKTYEGQSAANREAENREAARREKTDEAAHRADERQAKRAMELSISQELAAEAAQQASDDRRHREHVEQMHMLAKLREAQLMQTPEGRAILRREEQQREAQAKTAALAAQDRRDEAVRQYALNTRGNYYQQYEALPHPSAKSPLLPKGKNVLWVALSVLVATVLVAFFGSTLGVAGGFIVTAVLFFTLRPAPDVNPGRAMLPFTALITSMANLVIGRDEGNLFMFMALGVSLAGIAILWFVLSRTSRKGQRAAHSRALRRHELEESNDPDALVASLLSVDVEKVRLPAQFA